MKSQSLVRRTVFTVLAAELLCAITFSGVALWHENRSRMRAFDVSLQGRSDSILGAVQDAEDPDDNVRIDPIELKVPATDVYAVYNLGGRLLGSSKDAPEALAGRRRLGFSDRRFNGRTFRVFERNAMRVIDRADNGGDGLQRPITIVYASPTANIRQEILAAAGFYAAISVLLLAVTAALLVLLLRKVLSPIEELAIRAAAVSKDSLHFDAPASAQRVRELAPLAQALSATIASLKKAFDNEQRFVSDAAHELKTAVAVVRSTIQLQSMRVRSQEEYAQGLNRLLQDNQRVEDLVARMLTLARMEQEPASDTSAIDLGESARHTVDVLASLAQARSVSIILTSASNAWVRLSSEKAEALVSNLLVNAIQHSRQNSEITIDVARADDIVRLTVKDTGTGIAASALPRVFERFYREDSSRSRDTGGAGLGLPICKSIAESAGGRISMQSTPGVETIATVSFTLA